MDRDFTAKICSNKWYSLFPNQLDANRTVEYCAMLQKQWPNLQYFTKTETVPDKSRPPKLIALHIVWPWSQEIVATLAGKQVSRRGRGGSGGEPQALAPHASSGACQKHHKKNAHAPWKTRNMGKTPRLGAWGAWLKPALSR